MSHQLYNESWKYWSNLAKNPRSISPPYQEFDAANLSCGDQVRIKIRIQNNQIAALSFEATGCSICLGTIAFLSEKLTGLTMNEASNVIEDIEKLINGTLDRDASEELVHFELLQKFPTRVQCVKISTRIVKKAITSAQ